MKRFPVIHPFLFSLYPILAVLAASLRLLDAKQAIRPTLVILLITTLILVLLNRVYKNWYRAGFITSIVVFMLFYYGYSYRLPSKIHLLNFSISRHVVIICFWLVFLGVVTSKWLWVRVRPHVITNFLNITSGLVCVYGLYLLISVWMAINQDPLANWTRPENPLEDNTTLATTYRPDIYYIILDGYAREDVLQNIYNFDNSSFMDALKVRGFYIADESRTNYIYTQISLASSLNFEYLDYISFAGGLSSDWRALGNLILNSRLRSWLSNAGYQIYLSSEYLFTEINDRDVVFYCDDQYPMNTFESLLLESTMFEILVDTRKVNISNYTYETHRNKILDGFAEAKSLVEEAGPKLVFVHIIAPHAPFVFDQFGNPVQPDWEYTIFDVGDIYGDIDLYKEAYLQQLKYINILTISTIDYITQNSNSTPIIILQADHGPAAFIDNSPATSCLMERFSILNAYYFPDNNMRLLYSSISPVNTFRIVFNTYFGASLPILPDVNYFSSHDDPYNFIKVTNQISASCNNLTQP
jgi:hypothetical protein